MFKRWDKPLINARSFLSAELRVYRVQESGRNFIFNIPMRSNCWFHSSNERRMMTTNFHATKPANLNKMLRNIVHINNSFWLKTKIFHPDHEWNTNWLRFLGIQFDAGFQNIQMSSRFSFTVLHEICVWLDVVN